MLEQGNNIPHILVPLMKNIREVSDDDKADWGEVILQPEKMILLEIEQDENLPYPWTTD